MGFFTDPLHTPEYELKGNEVAVIETSKGTIRVALDGEGAPIHVANFCELAEKDVPHVGRGVFGAEMKIELVNDGPFTVWLDTDDLSRRK